MEDSVQEKEREGSRRRTVGRGGLGLRLSCLLDISFRWQFQISPTQCRSSMCV